MITDAFLAQLCADENMVVESNVAEWIATVNPAVVASLITRLITAETKIAELENDNGTSGVKKVGARDGRDDGCGCDEWGCLCYTR
jgi:cytidylate kinase